MQASVESLGVGLLHNGVVTRGGLAFQRGNYGSIRRPFRFPKPQRCMALCSSGQVQRSVQGSMKAKSTEAARKHASEKSRLYFQEPENRRRRSLSVKGAEFHCRHCGRKGHRRNYCPDLPKLTNALRAYHCSLCGQPGHKRTNCHSVPTNVKESVAGKKLVYKCSRCKEVGHNARSCQMKQLEEQVQEVIEGDVQN